MGIIANFTILHFRDIIQDIIRNLFKINFFLIRGITILCSRSKILKVITMLWYFEKLVLPSTFGSQLFKLYVWGIDIIDHLVHVWFICITFTTCFQDIISIWFIINIVLIRGITILWSLKQHVSDWLFFIRDTISDCAVIFYELSSDIHFWITFIQPTNGINIIVVFTH